MLPLISFNRYKAALLLAIGIGSAGFTASQTESPRVPTPLLAGWEALEHDQLPPGIHWVLLGPWRSFTRSCVNCAYESTSLSADAYAAALRAFHEREPLARWDLLGYVHTPQARWTCGLLISEEEDAPWTAQASTVIEGCGIVVTVVCSEGCFADRLQLLANVLKQLAVADGSSDPC